MSGGAEGGQGGEGRGVGRGELGGPGSERGSAPPASRGGIRVGVDAGGTRTRVLVLSGEGKELARKEGPGAPADPEDPSEAGELIADLVLEALDQAGVEPPAALLGAGVAGVGRAGARETVEAAIRRSGVAVEVRVMTDVEAAFRDAFPAPEPGILLVSGTGSSAMGRGEDGTEARVGGWGAFLGDEGSAWWIGREGLIHAVRQADGREDPGVLLPRMLEATGLEAPEEWIGWAASVGKSEVAGLAPSVLSAADAGDRSAGRIVRDAAQGLALHVAAVLRRLAPWEEPAEVVLHGGMLRKGSPLRGEVMDQVRGMGGRASGREADGARGAGDTSTQIIA